MKTPFTGDQFFEVFRDYNTSVFPMQVILYLMSFAILFLAYRNISRSAKIISGFLSFLWLWMGLVYHIVFFTTINKLAYVFGGLFIFQGMLFLLFGVLGNKLSFRFRFDFYGIVGSVFILFSLFFYPALGYYFGHVYPYSPTFGLPCPTTIFTFGILLLADKKLPASIIIIPLIWSVIGFTAVMNFGVKEDVALLVAGLITVPMLLAKNRKYSLMMRESSEI